MEEEPIESEGEAEPILRFTYQHGKNYRVIRVDGAWGSVTPRGDIIMSVFIERPPVPDYEEYRINTESEPMIGPAPSKRVTKTKGLIREIEVALSLRPDTAKNLGKWLIEKAEFYENAINITNDSEANVGGVTAEG